MSRSQLPCHRFKPCSVADSGHNCGQARNASAEVSESGRRCCFITTEPAVWWNSKIAMPRSPGAWVNMGEYQNRWTSHSDIPLPPSTFIPKYDCTIFYTYGRLPGDGIIVDGLDCSQWSDCHHLHSILNG